MTILYENEVKKYDMANSKLTCTIYHEQHWIQNNQKKNAVFYSLKFQQDDEYMKADDQKKIEIELGRVVNIVESKLTGETRHNRMKTIIVYLNHNQGGRIKSKTNPMVMKIVLRHPKVVKVDIYEEEEYWVEFLTSIVNQIQNKIEYYEKN